MSWQGIEGHDDIVEQFRRSLLAGRLGSTFLFVGPEGIGKHTFALKLAQSLLCETSSIPPLEPCGHCSACAQVVAGTHPDLDVISKPAEKSSIPIDLLIGDKQHRLREGLCAHIAMKPARGGRKVAIIDDADCLNQEGANCLLKTLEEPPPGSVLILIGTSPQRQLPTIRSRCQIIRFQPLDTETCAGLLLRNGVEQDEGKIQRLAALSMGSLARAREWQDEELWEFRQSLLEDLAQSDWDSQMLSKSVSEFVDAAGKEAPKRRARLRQVLTVAARFYREAMRHATGATSTADEGMMKSVSEFVRHCSSPEVAANCVERTHLARSHVDANANQSTNIEVWLDDLRQLLSSIAISHNGRLRQ